MRSSTLMMLKSLPYGDFRLHRNPNMNAQMNRWFSGVGDLTMLDDLLAVAPSIADNSEWIREFSSLADSAFSSGAERKAAYYSRAAEFVMKVDDPRRAEFRECFKDIVRRAEGIRGDDLFSVPYPNGGPAANLPALRFGSDGERGAILLFGGRRRSGSR